MEHRLRRKHLQVNSDAGASNEIYLKETKKNKKYFFQKKKRRKHLNIEKRVLKNMEARGHPQMGHS